MPIDGWLWITGMTESELVVFRFPADSVTDTNCRNIYIHVFAHMILLLGDVFRLPLFRLGEFLC